MKLRFIILCNDCNLDFHFCVNHSNDYYFNEVEIADSLSVRSAFQVWEVVPTLTGKGNTVIFGEGAG